MRGLRRLQRKGLEPRVITVLHPDGLDCADEYYGFYRENDIREISFSIDEKEGANPTSGFGEPTDKERITAFIIRLLENAYRDGFLLEIREVERIAQVLTNNGRTWNEQAEPWASIVVAADGSVSTFSPEFMEVAAPEYNNFVFGNILEDEIKDLIGNRAFLSANEDIAVGIAPCRASCRYFSVCGGGSPVNKFCETGTLKSTETNFCRLSTQSAADFLVEFLFAGRANRANASPTVLSRTLVNYTLPIAGEVRQ